MKLYILLSVCVLCDATNCDRASVIAALKKPIYDFSHRILDRVSLETDGNFVFSPISTWLQLTNIAEGARGNTLRQLWKVTRTHTKPCVLKTLRQVLNDVNKGTRVSYKTQSLVMVDKLMRVKHNYKKKLEMSDNVKVLSLDFDKPYISADAANEIISRNTNGEILDAVDPYDFNLTTLLLTDVATFSKAWSRPFNPSYTTREDFFVRSVRIGQVNMMSQTGRFNYTKLHSIDSEVLQLPCIDEKHSMLVFIPIKGNVKDIFFNMKNIRFATLFNLFRDSERLVKVKLPRFKIKTELDNLPELVHDMGVYDIFDPNRAKLRGISDYTINVSALRQRAVIDVTEEGVSALSETIITNDGNSSEFNANRPFAFMLVDRDTEIILFAGIYEEPSLY